MASKLNCPKPHRVGLAVRAGGEEGAKLAGVMASVYGI